MPDAHKNFAISAVASAPSPASSGTSLTVTAGHGSRFSATPFQAVVCPAGTQPDPTNAEVVRVTAITTDTFTIIRAQEGSSARSITVGDQIFEAITIKTIEDLETGLILTPIPAPAAPTVANVGTTGATTYTYALSAVNDFGGETKAPNTRSTTTGNATLSGTNYNTIAAPNTGDPRIASYNVWRTAGGTNQGLIGNVAPGATLNDTGLSGALVGGLDSTPPVDTSMGISVGTPGTVRGRLGQINFWDASDIANASQGSGLHWSHQSANRVADIFFTATGQLIIQVQDEFGNVNRILYGSSATQYQTAGIQSGQVTNFGNPITLDNPKLTIVAKTAAYTIADGDNTITCDATTAAFTVTLPAGSTSNVGVEHHIKKIDASANAVTVAASGTDTIEGAASVSLASQWAGVVVKHVGSGKWIKKP